MLNCVLILTKILLFLTKKNKDITNQIHFVNIQNEQAQDNLIFIYFNLINLCVYVFCVHTYMEKKLEVKRPCKNY